MTPAAPHGNELYFLSFRITSRYIVTLDCTCNVRQKSNGLLKSSQSDDVKSLWISYHSIVSDGIGNGEKPSISKHFLASGVTSRWLIGSTPKDFMVHALNFANRLNMLRKARQWSYIEEATSWHLAWQCSENKIKLKKREMPWKIRLFIYMSQ